MKCLYPLVFIGLLFAPACVHAQNPKEIAPSGVIPCETVAIQGDGEVTGWVMAHRREFFEATCLTAVGDMEGKPFAAYLLLTRPKYKVAVTPVLPSGEVCYGGESVSGYKIDCDEGNGKMLETQSTADGTVVTREVPSATVRVTGQNFVQMEFYSLHQARLLWKGYGSNSSFRFFGWNWTKSQRERFRWPRWLGTVAYATKCPKKGEYCDLKELPSFSK